MDARGETGSDGHGRLDRRQLLGGTAATATIAWFWFEGIGNPLRRQRIEPTRPGAPRRSLDEAAWATLEAVQGRLLPSEEGAPGAAEVNAIGYLDALLASDETEDETRARILEGAKRLEAFAVEKGATSYAALAPDVQDEGIRLFEQPWVQQMWLRNMISFTLEAFLGDPIHGGNVGERGWEWIGHEPPPFRPEGPWRAEGKGPREPGR